MSKQSQDPIEFIKSNYEHMATSEISRILNIVPSQIRQLASKYKIRKCHDARSRASSVCQKQQQKKFIRQNWNKTIKFNPETVYCLGFLWADGCFRKSDPKIKKINIFSILSKFRNF